MKQLPIIIAIAVLAVVGAAYYFFAASDKGSVSLKAATDKSSYASGEAVKLTVGLTNNGSSATCVSDAAAGNIRFLSVKKDGESVPTRTAKAYFITSLPEILKSKLTKVAPGETMEIAFVSSYDPGLEAEAFEITEPKGTSGMSTFYNIGEPGAYEIKLAYEYPGEPSADCSDVLRSSSNEATASFTITK